MARTHGLVVLSLIALGTTAWFLVCRSGDDAPPLPPIPPRVEGDATIEPVSPADGRMRAPTTEPGPAAAATPSQEPDPDRGETVEALANVLLVVRDRRTHAPLPSSTWRFVPRNAGAMRGDVIEPELALRLPPVAGTLLVECRGYRAESFELTPPSANEPVRRVDVFLASRAPATGVALELRAADGSPVTRVRIDLWQLEANAPADARDTDPTKEPLWKRQFEDADGLFAIEDLASGRYALRAQAVDEDGFALSLQPTRAVFDFHGHETVPLRADLATGQVVRLHFDGQVATQRQISLSVRTANGEQLSVPFRSVDAEGRVATGLDVARAPGRVESLIALPFGNYELECFLDELALPVRRGGAAIGAVEFVVTLPQ